MTHEIEQTGHVAMRMGAWVPEYRCTCGGLLYGDLARAWHLELTRRIARRPPIVGYWRGQVLVYVKVGVDRHFVTDAHWEEYLELRKERPRCVETFRTLEEMRTVLMRRWRVAV